MEIFGIVFSTRDVWLFSICGTLIMVLVGIGVSSNQDRKNIFRAAVTNFKSAFAMEISAISNDTFGLDTFTKNFERHLKAVDTIRPILPERYQRKLQKAWDEYCGKGNELGMDEKEFVSASSATIILENKELFREFIKSFKRLYGCLDELL